MIYKSSRHVILIITVLFTFLHIYYDYKWAIILSIIIGIFGILSSSFCEVINLIWSKMTEVISIISSRIILIVVYYIVLCPLAFFYKLKTKDPLMLKRNYKSYFISQSRHLNSGDFIKTW